MLGIYLVIGVIVLGVLWKLLGINWSSEATDTKLLMIATPLLWPLVLVFVVVVYFWK